MSINFRQLEVFRAVAEMQSFTRASHILFISQSTVSQHIRELEESLQVSLFSRNRRHVTLTAAGENLYESGRKIFSMLEQAEANVRTTRDPYCGRLSFGCASTTLLYHLPQILTEYTRKYPNVELNIMGGTIQDMAVQLWSGSLDLALVVPPIHSPALEKLPLCEEGFVGVLSARHALAKNRRLGVADLSAERFILNRQGQNTRKLVDRYLYRQRVTPRVAIELAETEAIKAMVARGLGVSILPESAFLDRKDSQDLMTFRISRKDLHRPLALVYPKMGPLRPPALALVEMLKTHFRER